MLFTEKEKGVVHQLTEGRNDPAVSANLNQPTFLKCDERGLWIVDCGLWIREDATHRSRLLLVDSRGRQQTILSFLKAPQSIVLTAKGACLFAERGHNRVLELVPSSVLEVHEEDELLEQHDVQGEGLEENSERRETREMILLYQNLYRLVKVT